MKKTLKWAMYCLLFVTGMTACEENDPETAPVIDPNPVTGQKGVFILYEGSWMGNNSGISYYNYEAGTTTYDVLGGKMGDTGNDILLYGNKIYVTASASGIISVFQPDSAIASGKELKKIEVKNASGASRNPRYLTGYQGKIYASTFDGNVIRIDTTLLSIDGIAKVGANPEGIACANKKLYVANSDAFNSNGPGNTVSVVRLSDFKEENVLTVGINPYLLKTDQYGDVYLSYRGVYKPGENLGGFQRIDTQNDQVHTINGLQAYKFDIAGDSCYYYELTYNADGATFMKYGIFNVRSEQAVNQQLITDGTTLHTAYGIGVNPATREVYIADTDYMNPSQVYIFDKNGKKKETINTGINPAAFVFY